MNYMSFVGIKGIIVNKMAPFKVTHLALKMYFWKWNKIQNKMNKYANSSGNE